MSYNPEIHRRNSIRLADYDYAQAGLYFITICVKSHECVFGEIIADKMQLSGIGIIADVLWYEIKNHTQNVILDEFVIMPNHIHGIIEITENTDMKKNLGAACRGKACLAPTGDNADMDPKSRFQNQGKNTLSSIVGSYKSAVSKHAHRLGFDFLWQRNYYEHIIHDHNDHARIVEYIENNPARWDTDRFYRG